MLFLQSKADFMIVSASLADATVKRVISSEMQTGMPAWALHERVRLREPSERIARHLDARRRRGPPHRYGASVSSGNDGWVHDAGAIAGRRSALLYAIRQFQNWLSSVSGGPTVRLTTTRNIVERGGSCSPDGGMIVYWEFRNGVASVMVVRTTGEATPVKLREQVGNPLPEWSPDGQWIKFMNPADAGGWGVISPDGKTVRSFNEPSTVQMTFSPDSKHLYGIRVEPDKCILNSLDIATKEEKVIGDISRDFTPVSYSNPGIWLSLSPDGKSILYPALRRSSSLWMLEGFDQPGWLHELRETIPG